MPDPQQSCILHRRGFTLIELLIIVVLLAIVAGLAMPSLGNIKYMRVREAGRLLASDIELAQSESIAHPDDPRMIQFDLTQGGYAIIPVSDPETPIVDPAGSGPMRIVYGQGRASGLAGVGIASISPENTDVLYFDAYGSPVEESGRLLAGPIDIRLSSGDANLTVRVEAGCGDVTLP